MDEIEMLREYGLGTRAKPQAAVEVTGRVLETIRRVELEHESSSVTRPWVYAAAAAWLVAATCGLYAQQAWLAVDDPLGALFSPFVVSMQ